MRKIIQDLACAEFQYEKPELRFSTERLEFEVVQKEAYKGSFSLTSVNGIPIRGIVYSLNQRMECINPKFEGTEIIIQFEFHSEGLIEGDTQKGEFIIVCNGGEYNLSFVASIIKFYPQTSIGQIKNLFDFANLARVSYDEAYRMFTAPVFQNILRTAEQSQRLLYHGLRAEKATLMEMEEFLIGIHKKKKVMFALEKTNYEFQNILQDVQKKVRIRKSDWGYLELAVTSDCDAIEIIKKHITTADFIGNYVDVEFIIHRDKLHGGKNYASLVFSGLNQTETCEICICTYERYENVEEETVFFEKRKNGNKKFLLQQLTQLYMDFRMGKMITSVWVKESGIYLKNLRELEPENQWYKLYQAQILVINKQNQEAEWILKDFNREVKEKNTPLYAYYMYICTLLERESSYVAKLFWRIKEIYKRNREDNRLFLIMLFLDSELNQNESRKLSVIEKRLESGDTSSVLYMEAYEIIRRNVYLLQKTDKVTMQILYWAVKRNMLNVEIADQISKIILQVKQFHPVWYKIITACYQINSSKEMLQVICSFCIKWNLYSKDMFEWYQKGVQEELRIAGLFEAWLNCAGEKQISQFPKPIMLYFQYQNNLNYKKKALLYACIVKNKNNQKLFYDSYEKNIEQFVVEQLLAGRIDEHLAILYKEFLWTIPWNEKLAEALSSILYANRLVCEDEQAEKIVVIHHELAREEIVPLINHQAYIHLYTDSYCIMAENTDGIRYVPTKGWNIEKLMQSEEYLEEGLQYAPNRWNYLLDYFSGKRTFHTYQEKDLPSLNQLMEMPEISNIYKSEIKPQMIEYYYNSYVGVELDKYLSEVDYQGLKRDERSKLMELMIARGIYNPVYEMLDKYGNEHITISKLVIIATQKILSGNYQQEDILDGLCCTIFEKGNANEVIIKYLCQYYHGSLQELGRLWKCAKKYKLDTYRLEEVFLIQLLYTKGYVYKMEEIFQSYFNAQGDKTLIMAYLSYFSHQYLRKDIVISDVFFECLQQQILAVDNFQYRCTKRKSELSIINDTCKLAYLKWITMEKVLTEEQERLQEELLEEYVKRHMYFAFYQNLPNRLLRKYRLYGKIFQEYRTTPGKRVIINYCYVESEHEIQYQTEYMEHMHDGIFVKAFVAFFGEEIPYYIKEEGVQGMEVTQSGYLPTNELTEQEDVGCYSLINDIMISYQMKDEKTLQQLYMKYEQMEQQVEDKFRLL